MTDLQGLGSAHAVVIAIMVFIVATVAVAMLALPFVAIFLPAILVLVSRRGVARTRLWVAAACVVASVMPILVASLVPEVVPTRLSRETTYWIGMAFWSAGIVAPWIIFFAFRRRVDGGGVGPARP